MKQRSRVELILMTGSVALVVLTGCVVRETRYRDGAAVVYSAPGGTALVTYRGDSGDIRVAGGTFGRCPQDPTGGKEDVYDGSCHQSESDKKKRPIEMGWKGIFDGSIILDRPDGV